MRIYKIYNGCEWYYINQVPRLEEETKEWGEWGLPIGAGIEIFSREAIEITHKNVMSNYDKEHVITYMKRNLIARYVEGLVVESNDYCPGLSLTVDTKEDYKKIQMIMANTHRNEIPPIQNVIDFCVKNDIK